MAQPRITWWAPTAAVYVRDLLAFKARRDRLRRRTLNDLARAEAAAGLYD